MERATGVGGDPGDWVKFLRQRADMRSDLPTQMLANDLLKLVIKHAASGQNQPLDSWSLSLRSTPKAAAGVIFSLRDCFGPIADVINLLP